MNLPFFILLCGMYLIIVYCLTKSAYSFFTLKGWVELNFEGKLVVQSFGVQFLLHYVIYLLLIVGFQNYAVMKVQVLLEVLPLLISLLIISIMGWLDDRYGMKHIKGLRGHLKAFFVEHKITSGFMKAVVGTLTAVFLSFFYSINYGQWIFHLLLIIFSIHVFNLLDVRPGRAIKGYWLLVVILLPFFSKQELFLYIIPFFLSSLPIFAYERKCLTMLGDAGANMLGALFGFYLVLLPQLFIQSFFFILFLFLGVLAEKYSFTEYIQKTPWLSRLDRWGIHSPSRLLKE